MLFVHLCPWWDICEGAKACLFLKITLSQRLQGVGQKAACVLLYDPFSVLCSMHQKMPVFSERCFIFISKTLLYFIITVSFLWKQGEDVALPEVPTEPVPEVPEAATAEPGSVSFLIQIFYSTLKCICGSDWTDHICFTFPERREAKEKPEREMLAA